MSEEITDTIQKMLYFPVFSVHLANSMQKFRVLHVTQILHLKVSMATKRLKGLEFS